MNDIASAYHDYISCLNEKDLGELGKFVHKDVKYNGKQVGLDGYRKMLEGNLEDIPDLYFNIGLLVADASYVAARLDFDCSPKGEFLGLPVKGKKVSFSENVFYHFRAGKIAEVWSVIDKAAIERQLK